jgi:hypothetical protein
MSSWPDTRRNSVCSIAATTINIKHGNGQEYHDNEYHVKIPAHNLSSGCISVGLTARVPFYECDETEHVHNVQFRIQAA